MPDLGLTHVALTARDLDASIAFYAKYAGMAVVHRRARDGVRAVWLTDHTRPFVIVLVEAAEHRDHPLGPFGHLGVACASREEIDRLYAEACREGRPTRAPIDSGYPVGYTARIADPYGHSLEISFGQEVGFTVQSAAKGLDARDAYRWNPHKPLRAQRLQQQCRSECPHVHPTRSFTWSKR
jgi:lactoylglutathione lyase